MYNQKPLKNYNLNWLPRSETAKESHLSSLNFFNNSIFDPSNPKQRKQRGQNKENKEKTKKTKGVKNKKQGTKGEQRGQVIMIT